MKLKCYICNNEMEKKITVINTGWGNYKNTINGINAYVCPECGEILLDSEDVIMLQKISKKSADIKKDK